MKAEWKEEIPPKRIPYLLIYAKAGVSFCETVAYTEILLQLVCIWNPLNRSSQYSRRFFFFFSNACDATQGEKALKKAFNFTNEPSNSVGTK